MKCKFNISKKYIRGANKGKRVSQFINLDHEDDIHSFLWDESILYNKKVIDYIIEHYTLV